MLHVALGELPRRGAQQMLARQVGLRDAERHDVLQLVAEAIGAARLIEAGARPDAAGERLIEQPAVQQDVHRAVGRLHLNRAERVVPERVDLGEDCVEIGGRGICAISACALRPASPPRRAGTTISAVPSALSSIRVCSAPHGSKPAPTPVGKRRAPGQRRRLIERAVAAEELRCGRRSRQSAGRARSAKATRVAEIDRSMGLRANIAPVCGVDLGDDERRRRARATAPSTHST